MGRWPSHWKGQRGAGAAEGREYLVLAALAGLAGDVGDDAALGLGRLAAATQVWLGPSQGARRRRRWQRRLAALDGSNRAQVAVPGRRLSLLRRLLLLLMPGADGDRHGERLGELSSGCWSRYGGFSAAARGDGTLTQHPLIACSCPVNRQCRAAAG